MWKAIGIGAICCVISFGAGYVLSYTTKYTNNDSEYAVRLANAERINRELQSANIRLGDLNTSLTGRLRDVTEQLSIISGKLARAKTVIGRIQSQLDTDGDTVQRLVETLSGLEQALQIIFAGS